MRGLHERVRTQPPWRGRAQQSLLVVGAIAIAVAMIVVAERGREDALRHLRAQALVERVRAAGQELSAISSKALAHTFVNGPRSVPLANVVPQGKAAFDDLTNSLHALQQMENGRTYTTLSADVGRLYAAGTRALSLAEGGYLRAALQSDEQHFTPAINLLNRDAQRAASHERAVAGQASTHAVVAFVGSLVVGLAALMLLGWRLHRMRRHATLAAERQALEIRSEQRLRALLEHSTDVVTVIGRDRLVRWQAGSVRRMLGHDPTSVIGEPLTSIVHPDDRELVEHFIVGSEQGDGNHILSARFRHADGGWRHVEMIADNRLDDPAVQGLVLNMRDVTVRKALEDELRHRAFHDPLTGLANRALFEDRLAHALAGAERHGFSVGVLFLDMDDFKTVNDTLGHARGDELLRAVARRITSTVRPTDTAARLGGDEFAVIAEVLEQEDEAELVARRVVESLARPFNIGGREVRISASVGVAVCGSKMNADDALRDADTAMYVAKQQGKASVRTFDPEMRRRALDRIGLQSELRDALRRQEFELDYQPIVALESGRIIGAEALVRWRHPDRARLAPASFIGIAEETGLIVPLGLWVLETACEQARDWHATFPARPPLQLSVNVSTRQLEEPDFARTVDDVLKAVGLPPETVTLEITESLLMDDYDNVMGQLERLKALGVRVAVDDFGTGYSAISMLRHVPIDILKIDRSFVDGIDGDREKAKLVQGIMRFGESLLLDVVAEGIERRAQADEVRSMRLPYGQGFLFSRPIAGEDLTSLVAAESAPGVSV